MVSLATKLKNFNHTELASMAFYAISGLVLLVSLPFTAYPPHLAFLGVLSLITAYSLFTKRVSAPWLVAILLVVISVFSLYTLYSVGLSSVLIALSMVAYAVLTWVFTFYLLLRRRT
jgi:hypothetical protein